MSYIEQILGNSIRKYRKLNNLTLEKLAEKVDITHQNLSNIERGKSFLKAETLEKICKALNVSPCELFCMEDLPEKIKNDDNIKPLLIELIKNFDPQKTQALYKLVLAFQEAMNK